MPAPPLKTDPKYGYFPRWPQDGDDWIHPDDVPIARAMIPSGRVFCRDGADGEYALLRYGDVTLRVRAALWQEIEPEGLAIGDWVEVLSRGMLNEPRTGTIREMLWDENARALRYQIHAGGQLIDLMYAREDLQFVERVNYSQPSPGPSPGPGEGFDQY
jgi:hypothetical protein